MSPVEIRVVRADEEFAACEAMSRDIWGAAERNVVPRELLKTIQLNGGLVQGAFLPAGRLIGFVFGFAGIRESRLRLCSHQLGVEPEFRGRGIGIALKEAQRAEALRLGYDLVTWTFDPLEARNAYLNLHRLGTVCRLYDRDHYGVMDDDLNRGLATDRWETEWWIRQAGLSMGRPSGGPLEGSAVLLDVGPDDAPAVRSANLSQASHLLVRIPSDFQALKRRSLELAREWRLASREVFEKALAAGFCALDFLRDGTYVMERKS